MEARRCEQSTRLGEDEDEDEDEKGKISFSPHFLIRQLPQQKEGGDGCFWRAGADGQRIQGHCNGPPPRRRAPSADAQADVVQAADDLVTTVDDTAAWSDLALANGTEAP